MAFKVFFEPMGKSGECMEGETVLECAHRLGISLLSSCGGRGVCGNCRVRVLEGEVNGPTASEREFFEQKELQSNWRLACQVSPLSHLRVFVPLESLGFAERFQVEGMERGVEFKPVVMSREVSLIPPSLNDVRADVDRVVDALAEGGVELESVDLLALKEAGRSLRNWGWRAKAVVWKKELIGLLPGTSSPLGVAVDLGTTKIALYLLDLEGGKTLSSMGLLNPQVTFGEDVITRIQKARSSPEKAEELKRVVLEAVNGAVDELRKGVGAEPSQIVEMVFVGNTAMHHLFLGLPVDWLAQSPFVPTLNRAFSLKARELGLKVATGAYMHFLPNIAGFVGSDHVAALLASGVLEEKGPLLLLDIGTNTEISLIKEGDIHTVSTPSGPAFEGAHLKYGMRALAGAIERVRIAHGKVWYKTIGDLPPRGICGSGIIDAVAELYRAGLLDERGRFVDGHPNFREVDGVKEFLLVEGPEAEGRTLSISQKDVRELQLAKASIRAAIEVLLKEARCDYEELEKVVIAGAFGTYISIRSALTLGMFPPLPLEKFLQVGNAAGIGAKMALLSERKRKEAESIASKARYIELAATDLFRGYLLEALALGEYRFDHKGRRC